MKLCIIIKDSGRLTFLKETACSQERLLLRVTNAHQTMSHWLLFAKTDRGSSKTSKVYYLQFSIEICMGIIKNASNSLPGIRNDQRWLFDRTHDHRELSSGIWTLITARACSFWRKFWPSGSLTQSRSLTSHILVTTYCKMRTFISALSRGSWGRLRGGTRMLRHHQQ